MTRRVLALLIGALLVAAAAYLLTADRQKHATAYFPSASGIHVDDEVRVLGVRVGEIDEIVPEGDHVRVRFGYDAARKVPADTSVALVAPSLVSGRYLQLAPVYRGGPVLADEARIPIERTAVPAEWDQTNAELTELTRALGPHGANRQGAVSRAIEAGANNLGGNGAEFRRTLDQLAGTSGTVAAGSEDLFTSLRQLDELTAGLNDSRQQLTTFSTQLASLSALADDNGAELGRALAASDRALVTITDFTRTHQQQLGDTVGELRDVGSTLAASRGDLADVLHVAPQTLANLYNVYEPSTGSASTRIQMPYTASVSSLTCQMVFSAGGTIDDCRAALDPLLKPLDMPYPPVGLDPLHRTGNPHQRPAPGGP
ncbi:MCE family protein [Saccharopolyspora flava]|uniref:Phospholipid/cholesterol/gamma-HCH transport system substrate-binding protein n=1 Tax=Saccharopolyspora flava TaxID=95161 RepID=A0A1I6S4D3_9PSEU|nr:MCE family protein [Saccharopolyspora flava]SFS71825.1 phospholipid/cholesterol/gamma-HCH transport system substrate-binding protein [Saccharopolyspora flava]